MLITKEREAQIRMQAEGDLDTALDETLAEIDSFRSALEEINMSACYGCEENPDAAKDMLARVGIIARRALKQYLISDPSYPEILAKINHDIKADCDRYRATLKEIASLDIFGGTDTALKRHVKQMAAVAREALAERATEKE